MPEFASVSATVRPDRWPGFQLFHLALHELQMNVERVERIADFMRDARRQQRQRLDTLAFDGFKSFLPRFGRIVQDERHAGFAGFAVQRGGI
jgi:hypothetical protein